VGLPQVKIVLFLLLVLGSSPLFFSFFHAFLSWKRVLRTRILFWLRDFPNTLPVLPPSLRGVKYMRWTLLPSPLLGFFRLFLLSPDFLPYNASLKHFSTEVAAHSGRSPSKPEFE